MLFSHITLRRWTLAAIAIGGLAAAGTAGAQGTPSNPPANPPATPKAEPKSAPKTGAYGGSTYGGSTYGTKAAPISAPTAETPPPSEPAYQPVAPAPKPWYQEWGLVLSAGGGVEGFTNQNETGTNTGGDWNVRASVGTRHLVGVEVSYIGSAQSIDALGLDTNAVLLGNGVQGDIRVNGITGYGIDFFGFVGGAWRHYSLSNEDFNTSDVANSDNVFEIPVGAGLQFTYEGFLVDARGTYRLTSGSDLFLDGSNVNNNMDRWSAEASIGYQF